ncbi:hypothetical protein BKI52_07235 [marine bacterium AO1-C]|nr:hypothetical protein BKI52_07235 [marine bacterium AO1-C]
MNRKAFVYKKYGSPEVLKLEQVAMPQPQPHEVLIKVAALSLNPAEWHTMRAALWMLRLKNGLFKPKHPILGADVAGKVVAVGAQVHSLKVGDQVFGRNFKGGIATHTCLDENKAAKIPQKLNFEEAAATPLASITALVALRKGHIQAGQQVLINGASGGIGTFAIQLAKHYNAVITGVCSGQNSELVHSLGANRVIDYQQEDFTKTGDTYDLVIDLVGNRPIDELQKVLKPGGRCMVVGFSNVKNMLGFLVKGGWVSRFGNKKFIPIDAQIKTTDLEYIGQLVQDGIIYPLIDRAYDFEATPEAFHYLGTRRAKGKIVITM